MKASCGFYACFVLKILARRAEELRVNFIVLSPANSAMPNTETQRISVNGFLTGTIHSRITKRRKGADLEGVEPYRSFYLSVDKDDIRSKQLSEGDRLTLGVIKIERTAKPTVEIVEGSSELSEDRSKSEKPFQEALKDSV